MSYDLELMFRSYNFEEPSELIEQRESFEQSDREDRRFDCYESHFPEYPWDCTQILGRTAESRSTSITTECKDQTTGYLFDPRK